MVGNFFEIARQFASSDRDDENPLETLARVLDEEGREEFRHELRAISMIDQPKRTN